MCKLFISSLHLQFQLYVLVCCFVSWLDSERMDNSSVMDGRIVAVVPPIATDRTGCHDIAQKSKKISKQKKTDRAVGGMAECTDNVSLKRCRTKEGGTSNDNVVGVFCVYLLFLLFLLFSIDNVVYTIVVIQLYFLFFSLKSVNNRMMANMGKEL